jgi:predicted RNase H-like nuclease (RuvC/YqgF family)
MHAISEHTRFALERDRWQAELDACRERRQEEREPQTQTPQQVVQGVDAQIDEKFNLALDAAGEAIGHERAAFQQALDRQRAEIRLLRRELRTLRDEFDAKLNLKAELAAARGEIEQLRRRSPDFKAELDNLRAQVARQEKTISRLRGEQSQLAYAQKQLDAEQQKNRHEVSLTAVRVTAFGQRTENILRELYENGFNVVEEMQSPSGSIS